MYKKLTEQDSWIVFGAFRTGSTVVAELIRQAYSRVGIELRDLQPVAPFRTESIVPKDILHSHAISELNLANKNTTTVIVTRNPIESVLSWLIRQRTGVWHHRPKESNLWYNIKTKYVAEDTEIKPFRVDPEEFLNTLDGFIAFYDDLNNILKTKKHIKIDYSEFKNDVSVLFNKLNLEPFRALKLSLPVKTPGSPELWIENWKEISNIIKGLDSIQY